MNCCKKRDNIWYFAIIVGLISILFIWNIVLTIIVAGDNNGDNEDNDYDCYCVEQMTNIIEQITRFISK